MSSPAEATGGGALAATGAALVLLAVFVWRGVLGLELFGWDTYPMIRAHALDAGLGAALAEELMAGRYPLGHFWRPLAQLSIALDHALFGLDAAAFHRTDLAILAASAVALAWVARRLAPDAPVWVPLVAGLVWVLHPVHVDVLPVPPRRAESLAVLFTLLAVGSSLGTTRRAALVAGLFALAAAGSKETGVLAAALVALVAFLRAPEDGGSRLGSGLRAAAPALGAAVLFVALRTAILGGLGGSAESSLAGVVTHGPGALADYGGAIVAPALQAGSAASLALLTTLAVALLAGPMAPTAPRGVPVPAVLLGWLAALAALTGLSGVERAWYALPYLPPVALAIAWCLGASVRDLRAGRRAALVRLAAALALVGSIAPRVAVLDATPELSEVSGLTHDFLERFDAAAEAAQPGERRPVTGLPMELERTTVHGATRKILPLAPYSLEAYAELTWSDRTIEVQVAGRETGPVAPGAARIVLAPPFAR